MNAGLNLPDSPITTVHRADVSGTSFIFTRYLAGQSQDFNNNPAPARAWNGLAARCGNAGVAQIVQQTPGSIATRLAYAIKNKIPFALFKNKDGNFIKVIHRSGFAGRRRLAVGGMKGDILVAPIWNQPGEKAYPISSFTYIIIHKDLGVLKNPAKAKGRCLISSSTGPSPTAKKAGSRTSSTPR